VKKFFVTKKYDIFLQRMSFVVDRKHKFMIK
jgi:hypothetical protein